jgi:putative salt-induced outer membrane protein YdiY
MRPFTIPEFPRSPRAAAVVLLAGFALAAGTRPVAGQDGGGRAEWRASAELTFTDASGNQNVSLITTGLRVRHRNPRRLGLDLRLQGRYGSSERDGERERVAESYRGMLNVDVGPGRRWTPFVHMTADHDPFRRLDARINTGAGAKLQLERDDGSGEFDASLALLHSYEALRSDNDRLSTRAARWSLRLSGQQKLTDGVTLTHSSQYQPVHGGLDDYLLNVETAVKLMVTERLAISIAHEYDRDSTPAEGVHKDDRLLRAGLLIEL